MRGKVLFFKELERDDRITPAYAGKSVQTKQKLNCAAGSPPPMRGKAFF